MNLDYSVNYRNVSSFNFKNNYFTSSDGVLPEVCEEQQVSPVKGRLHTATGRKHKVTISGTECPKGSQSKLPAMDSSLNPCSQGCRLPSLAAPPPQIR